MGRTNIDIDDELVAEVMRRLGVKTKKEAVDLALRRVAGARLTKEDLDAVRGVGFEIELADLRNDRVSEW
ncbi:MAG: type II toxin-antitoxin system VapB family antitoxin [Pseudonocardiaceae bacterium]